MDPNDGEQEDGPGFRNRRAAEAVREQQRLWANAGQEKRDSIKALGERLKECDEQLRQLKAQSRLDATAADAVAAELMSASTPEALAELEAQSIDCVSKAEQTAFAIQSARAARAQCGASFEPLALECVHGLEESLREAQLAHDAVEARCAGIAAQLSGMTKKKEEMRRAYEESSAQHSSTKQRLADVSAQLAQLSQAHEEAQRKLASMADYDEIKARSAALSAELQQECETTAQLRREAAAGQAREEQLQKDVSLGAMKLRVLQTQHTKIDAVQRDIHGGP